MSRKMLYPALDGLRVVAVTGVFFSHFWMVFPMQNPLLNRFFAEGGTGVLLFFVLSGFLVGNHYFPQFEPTVAWAKHFLFNRIRRIYPLYILLTMLVLVENKQPITTWLVNILLLKGLMWPGLVIGIDAAWTLTVDMMFYLSVPLIFIYWKRVKLVPMVSIFLVIGSVISLLGKLMQWNGSLEMYGFMLFSSFFGLAFEFLIGMWLGVTISLKKKVGLSPLRNKTYLGTLLITVMIVMLIYLERMNIQSIGFVYFLKYLVYTIAIGFGAMLLIWGLITEKSMVRWLLSLPLMQLLGKSTYAFFLVHYTFIALSLYRFVDNNFWLFFASLWILSIGLHLVVEKPIAKRLKSPITL